MSVQRCKELFMEGHNCAQAVAGGFAKEMGMTEEKAMAVATCFGAGICATRGLCGAVSGALMVLGAVKNKTNEEDKKYLYAEGRALMEKFEKEFSTAVCEELLTNAKARFEASPMSRTEEYYKSRPCIIFVEFVAKELEKLL